MKKMGVFLNNELIESFEEGKEAFEKSLQLSAQSGLTYTCRPIRFTDRTDEEKLQIVSNRLKDLQSFLLEMKGSGRTYHSHTNIDVEELDWLVHMTTENLKR
jgi:hypothetical protein